MFALPVLKFAANRFKKSRAAKKALQSYKRMPEHVQQQSGPPPRPKRFQPLAAIPLVITSIVIILSLLCIYAGHTTSMMQDYAVFTLNTSRVGENVVHKLESEIKSFNLSNIGLKKRDDFVALHATPMAVPTTLITMAPIAKRVNIGSLYSKATHQIASDVKSLKSNGKSDFNAATSAIQSKITSAESAVASEAAKIINEIESGLIKLINEAYTGFIDGLNIQDFYNVHVMASCKGTYVFENGKNVTVGASGYPTPSGSQSVHSHVDSCEQHSAVDPMSLIRIIYWSSAVFTIASFFTTVWALIRGCSKKVLLLNLSLTTFASISIALASLVVHGIALAATKVINFLGSDLGLQAYMGGKFLAMTWAATALLTLNSIIWIVIYYVQKRQKGGVVRGPARKEEYPMHSISQPMPVHQRPQRGGYL